MARNVADLVARIKRDLDTLLGAPMIQRICQSVGYEWRDRSLDPVTTVRLFVRQILEGNTACTHVTQWCHKAVTAVAYCQARRRLPLELFVELLLDATKSLRSAAPAPLWRGHRVYHADGSSFSMPDEPELQRAFGHPSGQLEGCSFPVAKLLAMMDAATGMIVEVFPLPLHSHEQSSADAICGRLKPGEVLVADRGFCSFAQMALLSLAGVFSVFRIHQRILVDFTPGRGHRSKGGSKGKRLRGRPLPYSRWLRALGVEDQIVSWPKGNKPDWMSEAEFARLPQWLEVRELRYRVTIPGRRTRSVTLVTTFLDGELYPAAELAELYGTRWDIELNFRHLKTTMRMEVLKCKTLDGVLKELMMFCFVYNLVRRVMCESAQLQKVSPNRVSFVDTLRWLKEGMPLGCLESLEILPHRPGRVQPRVRKRRPKEYPLMRQPRGILKQRLLQQSLAS